MKTYFTFTRVNLSCKVGVQHDSTDQHNHFGGPTVNKDNLEEQFEDHVEDDNFDEDVDEDAHVGEEVHLVGDDESSTDDNFDMFGQGSNKTNPKTSLKMNLSKKKTNP